MKTLSIKNLYIEEIILARNLPMVVRYRLLSDDTEIPKTVQIPLEELPKPFQTSVTGMISKVLSKLETDEQINQ
jgi:hypothetical protein